jgi:Ca2+-binding RTX toxin-like protein
MEGEAGNDIYVVDSFGDKGIENADSGIDSILTTLSFYFLPLSSNIENLSFVTASGGVPIYSVTGMGNDLDNLIRSGDGSDLLYGRSGSDLLVGRAGNDILDGGDGDDTAVVSGNRGDYVFSRPDANKMLVAKKDGTEADSLINVEHLRFADGSVGNLTLDDLLKNTASKIDDAFEGSTSQDVFDGLAGNDAINGLGGNDSLTGGLGNDTLDGGSGDDMLTGGKGNDLYIVDSGKDEVTENLNEGTDTVNAHLAAYTLTDNVENLVFAGIKVITGPAPLTSGVTMKLGGTVAMATAGDTLAIIANDTILATAVLNSSGSFSLDLIEPPALNGVQLSFQVIHDGHLMTAADSAGKPVTVRYAGVVDATKATTASISGTLGGYAETFAGTGNNLANTITGSLGNDTLDGGRGVDRLIGGAGDDTYLVDRAASSMIDVNGNTIAIAGDRIIEIDANGSDTGGIDTIQTALATYTLTSITNVENLTYTGENAFRGTGNTLNNLIIGGAVNDILAGGDGSDTLFGKGGNDILKGGNGDDVLYGEAGNDTLDGGNDTDTVILAGNRADYVFSRPDVGKVQVARNDGTETDLMTGIEQVKFADGSIGQVTLDDLLKNTASKFDDNYEGGNDANVFDGLAGNDSILGGGGNDSLSGGLGNDTLDGGTGSDQLSGGLGNDLYIVDTDADPDPAKAIAGDVVSEALNAGIDKVQTSLMAYVLGANLENLDYLGTPVTVLGSDGKPTGTSQVQQLAFTGTGNNLANTITGGTGNDTLDGGLGVDKLIGGAGDDTYVVDRAASSLIDANGNSVYVPGDQTLEQDNAGIDTVRASTTSWTLAANVENLLYIGSDSFRGTGNLLANLITGNSGNDTLSALAENDILNGMDGNDKLLGGDGNDVLNGGQGDDTLNGGNDNDRLYGNEGSDVILGGIGDDTLTGGVGANTLTGGADADIFVFNNSPDNNAFDLIADFKTGVDHLSLDTAIFGITDLNQTGLLVSNLADMTADTRLIYQYDAKAKSGILYYDDDGLGDHAMVAVAKLAGVASLVAMDFMVGLS